jgi:hypothetical protein
MKLTDLLVERSEIIGGRLRNSGIRQCKNRIKTAAALNARAPDNVHNIAIPKFHNMTQSRLLIDFHSLSLLPSKRRRSNPDWSRP